VVFPACADNYIRKKQSNRLTLLNKGNKNNSSKQRKKIPEQEFGEEIVEELDP
jgi:hypothetical protein